MAVIYSNKKILMKTTKKKKKLSGFPKPEIATAKVPIKSDFVKIPNVVSAQMIGSDSGQNDLKARC
jgi:hypothetical protein